MGNWQYINNQDDVEKFIKVTRGMHDSYMVGLDYMAGTWGDDTTTFFAGPDSKNLRVIFNSPWTDDKIEMIFESVRRFHIAGWQERYSDEMLECSIELEKLKDTGASL